MNDFQRLVLRFSTGENWNGFMREMLISQEGCEESPSFNPDLPWCLNESDYPNCSEVNGCGGGLFTYIYFYTFTLIVSFVVLNLFVGVVLDAFNASAEGDILGPNDLEHFIDLWAEFDPDACGYISTDDLKHFVLKLDPPLGILDKQEDSYNSLEDVLEKAELLELRVSDEGMVNIVHVATELAKRIAKRKQGDEFDEIVDEESSGVRLPLSFQSVRTLGEIVKGKIVPPMVLRKQLSAGKILRWKTGT